jgi:hypothetical protein
MRGVVSLPEPAEELLAEGERILLSWVSSRGLAGKLAFDQSLKSPIANTEDADNETAPHYVFGRSVVGSLP